MPRRRRVKTPSDGTGKSRVASSDKSVPIVKGHVTVVVMGSLGRSPRVSIIRYPMKCGYNVSLVGSNGEPCVAALVSNPRIVEYQLSPHLGVEVPKTSAAAVHGNCFFYMPRSR